MSCFELRASVPLAYRMLFPSDGERVSSQLKCGVRVCACRYAELPEAAVGFDPIPGFHEQHRLLHLPQAACRNHLALFRFPTLQCEVDQTMQLVRDDNQIPLGNSAFGHFGFQQQPISAEEKIQVRAQESVAEGTAGPVRIEISDGVEADH